MYGTPLDKIGQGAYADVYQTNKNYAIKVLNENNDVHIVHAFKEFLASRIVESKYCMPILDIGYNLCPEFNNKLSLVMPLGQSLNSDIPFNIIRFKQIVQGVKDLHAKDIWHLDIKLANCIQLPDRVVLADLGGCLFRASQENARFAITTLYARPPEILLNGYYNEKSDIWSLGCLLYHWLTGELPFGFESELSVLFNQFKCLGTPNEDPNSVYYWPNVTKLPYWKTYLPIWTGNRNLFNNVTDLTLRDLLTKMLVLNPDKRISLDQILAHPALQINNDKCLSPLFKSYPIPIKTSPNFDNIAKICDRFDFTIYEQDQIYEYYGKIVLYLDSDYDLEIFYIICVIMNFNIKIDELIILTKPNLNITKFLFKTITALNITSIVI